MRNRIGLRLLIPVLGVFMIGTTGFLWYDAYRQVDTLLTSDSKHTFVDAAGGFAADFPIPPQHRTRHFDAGPIGVDAHLFVAARPGHEVYCVMYLDMPFNVRHPKAVAIGCLEGFVQELPGGRIEARRSGGSPQMPTETVDWSMTGPTGVVLRGSSTAIVVNNRAYLVIAGGFSDATHKLAAFRKSFRLLDPTLSVAIASAR